jgi:hypothetical protein
MNDFELQMVAIAIVALLLILVVFLRCRPGDRTKEPGPQPDSCTRANCVFPGIDPADHATPAEQQAFLEQLATLPQIRRLPDGALVDWMNGTWLIPCICPECKATPHLNLVRLPEHGLGMISRGGLNHYLAYQQEVARQLRGNGGDK